jgi:DNA-damage-inducible protein D
MIILEYSKWENFEKVINKAKESCKNSCISVLEHFSDVKKTIKMPKGAEKTIVDYKLTRYACYLIAQNGDPSKEGIAFAQTYFAMQVRNMELIIQKFLEYERVNAREKLSQSEKTLSGLIYERKLDNKVIASVRSQGDKILFGGRDTKQMKKKLKIKNIEPLADYLPTVTLKAKDLANEMTNYNLKKNKKIKTESNIISEHIKNNKNIRKALVSSGIFPERLPREESIKKVNKRLKNDEKTLINNK